MAERPKVSQKHFWDMADTQGALSRPVSQEDVAMLRSQWPFLELISWRQASSEDDGQDAAIELLTPPEGDQGAPCILHAKASGWPIQYWLGNADYASTMSSAGSGQLYGGQDGQGGTGTVAAQAFHTAKEMVQLAQAQQWPGVQILSGSENMQWAAWAACEALGMPCVGFTPGPEAHARAERAKHLLGGQHAAQQAPSQSMGQGQGGASSDDAE